MFTLACIGLDTSHAIKFTELLHGPHKTVDGFRILSCMRFPSAFHSEPDQDKRAETMKQMGVQVTTSFSEAVKGADGILLEINDPSLHLKYFELAAETGLPVFLDKPLADTTENGKKIINLAHKKNTRLMSSSSLRFTPEIKKCCAAVPEPAVCDVFGPLGKAPTGSSIVWYGVHAFEMLSTIMGRGADKIYTKKDAHGAVSVVTFKDGRRGVVHLNSTAHQYGGRAQIKDTSNSFTVNFADANELYSNLITAIADFFIKGTQEVPLENTFEIQTLLNRAEESIAAGKEVAVGL